MRDCVKVTLLLAISVACNNSLHSQITLESNSGRRKIHDRDTAISNYYFQYKRIEEPGLHRYGLVIDEGLLEKMTDEWQRAHRAATADSIARLRAAYAKVLEANARDSGQVIRLKKTLDSAIGEISRLALQAAELTATRRALNMQRISLRFKSDSSELATIEKTFKEVENNLRRLLHIGWDFDKLIDTTKAVANYNEFFDSVVNLRADMESLLENDIVVHYYDIKQIKDQYFAIFEDTLIQGDPGKFDRDIAPSTKRIKRIHAELRTDSASFNRISERWNALITKFIKSKKRVPSDEGKIDVSALPFFNLIPGLKDINSSLSVFGSNKPSQVKNGLYTEFGGFTGLFGNKETENFQNLLIPESSNYGFFLKLNLGLVPRFDTSINRVGINGAFHFLGKSFRLNPGSTDAVRTSLFQGKFGLEYVLIKNLMSVYSNVNTISLIENKEQYNAKFQQAKDIKGFVDFGFRMLLEPGKGVNAGQFKLYFDLNFIVNGGDIKPIVNSTDNIITNIRFGLRTTLGPL